MFQLLQDEDAGPFADHKAVAVFVKRAAGMFRVGVAGGKRSHGSKASHTHGRDGGLGAAGDDHVRIVPLDGAKSVAHGMRTGGASRRCRLVRPQRTVADAHLAGRQVGDGGRNKKW